jgi:hypothetical protein
MNIKAVMCLLACRCLNFKIGPMSIICCIYQLEGSGLLGPMVEEGELSLRIG